MLTHRTHVPMFRARSHRLAAPQGRDAKPMLPPWTAPLPPPELPAPGRPGPLVSKTLAPSKAGRS
jgi:hypothetical protein